MKEASMLEKVMKVVKIPKLPVWAWGGLLVVLSIIVWILVSNILHIPEPIGDLPIGE